MRCSQRKRPTRQSPARSSTIDSTRTPETPARLVLDLASVSENRVKFENGDMVGYGSPLARCARPPRWRADDVRDGSLGPGLTSGSAIRAASAAWGLPPWIGSNVDEISIATLAVLAAVSRRYEGVPEFLVAIPLLNRVIPE